MSIRSFFLSSEGDNPELSNTTVDEINRLLFHLSPGKVRTPHDLTSFGKILDQGTRVFCIGDFGGCQDPEAVIAMASLITIPKLTGISGEVHDVVVDQDYQGQGYGKRIIEEVIAFAKSIGMIHLDLTSRKSREAANHLYESLSFQKRDTNYYRLVL